MPQTSKGARLWLKPAYKGEKSVWIIRDGGKCHSTGCGPRDREEAERQLADYLAAKYRPSQERSRDPAEILIADVLMLYAEAKSETVRRPAELGQRLEALLSFFGDKRLVEVNGRSCRAYAAQRGSDAMARRELEDLRAAINHHRKEGLCGAIVEVSLPPKPKSRERWLTRSEAARLIRAAWRYREIQKGVPTERRSRRHLARFILVGLYTGTRSGAICGAALTPAIGRGWVDCEAGLFYRKFLGDRDTKKRQPTVRLPARLLAHLRRWKRLGIAQKAVVEFEGEPVKSVRKAFARAAVDAGLAGVSPHVLRHTAVSWAMQNGADLWEAAGYFGMTVEVLERVYGHHRPDHHKGVIEAVTRRAGRS